MSLLPLSITTVKDVLPYINEKEKTLILWDADDTLVANPNRDALVENETILDSIFNNNATKSGMLEHKILTAGTVDDLFNDKLAPWADAFISKHIDYDRVIHLPMRNQTIFITPDLMGITNREYNVLPSSRSVYINMRKTSIVFCFATSEYWDHVIYIDNSLEEIGSINEDYIIKYITDNQNDNIDIYNLMIDDKLFGDEFSYMHILLNNMKISTRTTICHFRMSEMHPILCNKGMSND